MLARAFLLCGLLASFATLASVLGGEYGWL